MCFLAEALGLLMSQSAAANKSLEWDFCYAGYPAPQKPLNSGVIRKIIMIEYESDHSRFIYHYTSLETAEQYILPSGTLRLSQYTGTNDPKETRHWQFTPGTNGTADLSKYSNTELSDWLSSTLKNHTKVICFCTDQPDLTGSNIEDLFKRGYTKPRMWAQYGANHRGVCLVIDKAKFIAEVEAQAGHLGEIVHGKVSYRDESPIFDQNEQHFLINVDTLEAVGRHEYALRHLGTHYKELFFQKLRDWKDESEWRCLVFSSDSKDLYINLRSSFVGIVYGDGLIDDEVRRLMSLTDKYNPDQLALKWKNSGPWYDYANPLFWESR